MGKIKFLKKVGIIYFSVYLKQVGMSKKKKLGLFPPKMGKIKFLKKSWDNLLLRIFKTGRNEKILKILDRHNLGIFKMNFNSNPLFIKFREKKIAGRRKYL